MHGISKPNRNIFELSVLLNYFLTRYSGSDGKVPGFLSFLFSLCKVPGQPSSHSVSSFPSPAKNRPTLEQEALPTARPATVYRYVQRDGEMICKVIERPCLPVYRNSSSSQGLGAYRLRFVPCNFCKLGVRHVSQMGVIPDQHLSPSISRSCPSQYPLSPPQSRPLCPEITKQSPYSLCPFSASSQSAFLKCKSEQVSPCFINQPPPPTPPPTPGLLTALKGTVSCPTSPNFFFFFFF